MKIAPAGDRALLITLADVTAAELHAAAAEARARDGVVAVIPGHSSLYVIFDKVEDRQSCLSLVLGQSGQAGVPVLHQLRVSFNGPDLDEFLAHARITKHDFLKRLETLTLTARYLGFRGGFAYLDGWPEEWSMPRRATSRPVARGSFAIAGSVAGFYPIDTPGGWNLLGRTDANLEHALSPGDEITIEPTLDELPLPAAAKKAPLTLDYAEVLAAPLATLVGPRDWSRTARGASPGGPFDPLAASLANRAVGNDDDAPLLECAIAGPRLRMREERVIAFDGNVRHSKASDEIAFGKIEDGLRAYLAAGTREVRVARIDRGDRLTIHAMRGPHDVGLGDVVCAVTPQLDRVGIRLQPLEAIDAKIPADLRSCGMQCGSVQLHPDGSMVAMGPDHPVTGGYLQPMTVLHGETWKLAQLMPGERVTFVVQEPRW